MPSKCKECGKNASYNMPNVKGRLYCKEHAKPGMVSGRTDTRVCIHVDHDKSPRASYNYPSETRPIYCKLHSLKGMINLNSKNSKCIGCNKKQPSYGNTGGKATHCSSCSTKDMIDLVSNLCIYEECRKNATYGMTGGKAKYCSTHAKIVDPTMIDVKNKRCKECSKQPTYGITEITHCKEHKTDEMVDLRHCSQLCKHCNTRSTFGYPGGKAVRCTTHKKDTMIDLVSIMCNNCKIMQPNFNYKGKSL